MRASAPVHWLPLGSGGGFSGSRLWRGADASGAPVFALKAWPYEMTVKRLVPIHAWMGQASHLPFVPDVLRANDGSTTIVDEGRAWDLTRWLPGTADFSANPSAARLANACAALAELHRAWRPSLTSISACPAVLRRLRVLSEWKLHRAAFATVHDDLLRRGVEAVARVVEPAERALRAWIVQPVPVQPCLCDVWHDHVLFTGNAVSGIVDYGAMKLDHVAVDLARMLGDFAGEDDAQFERGLAEYRTASGILDLSSNFVRLLDRTGIACGTIVWLLRLCVENRRYADPVAVARRVAYLIARIETLREF